METGIRNWIGKMFFLLIGMVLLFVVFYPHAMLRLLLTDRIIPAWNGTDWLMLAFGASSVAGGVFLNRVLDGLSSLFRAITRGVVKYFSK